MSVTAYSWVPMFFCGVMSYYWYKYVYILERCSPQNGATADESQRVLPKVIDYNANGYEASFVFLFDTFSETGKNPALPEISVLIKEDAAQEARNTLFCPSQEKFHTVVLKGVSNISDTL